MEGDFVLRQSLAGELRKAGVDVVELSNSSRFLDMVDEQNPDIVLISLDAIHESVRALLVLKECNYFGAVQLFGQCEPKMLESLQALGADCSLRMLPPIHKPIKVSTIYNVIQSQKLGAASAPSAGISLADALKKNLIRFLYQPKFDLKARVMIGAEAVARVAHPDLGLLTPDQFLKGADEELLVSLSRLALLSAIKASVHFHKQSIALPIALNMSVDNLLKIPVADIVLLHRPEDSGWAGVILDMPERQVVNRIDLLKARSPKLQQVGVSIAIDNFGRMSTNLEVMNKIDFAEIKIDRPLVEDCATNIGNMKICKTLIQMAHNFGCRAVAVGISKETDLRKLAELDCDVGQGFLFGKPMTVEQIDAMITNYKGSHGSVN